MNKIKQRFKILMPDGGKKVIYRETIREVLAWCPEGATIILGGGRCRNKIDPGAPYRKLPKDELITKILELERKLHQVALSSQIPYDSEVPVPSSGIKTQ